MKKVSEFKIKHWRNDIGRWETTAKKGHDFAEVVSFRKK